MSSSGSRWPLSRIVVVVSMALVVSIRLMAREWVAAMFSGTFGLLFGTVLHQPPTASRERIVRALTVVLVLLVAVLTVQKVRSW